jgi:hypothetical protein
MNSILFVAVVSLLAEKPPQLQHVKRTQGPCTFEFDALEPFKPAKDGSCSGPTCASLKSKSFEFVVFEGAELFAAPHHVVDMIPAEHVEVFRGTENGVALAVVTQGTKTSCSGAEVRSDAHITGCAFTANGPQDREAELTQLCKSVKITVKAKK